VGSSAGYDFEMARILKPSKCPDKIAIQAIGVNFAAFQKPVVINSSEMVNLRLGLCPVDFAPSQPYSPVQIAEIAIAQEFVIQHRAQRRRQ
jgi:hypothetical protein